MRPLAFILLCVICQIMVGQSLNPPLIPRPVSATWNKGWFPVTSKTAIVAPKGMRPDAEAFNDLLERAFGFTFRVSSDMSLKKAIVLMKDESLSHEAYKLSVTQDAVTISANGAGVWYGLMTLLQMIPPDAKAPFGIPCGEISDAPRYQWRGMHLDVCRHFFPVDFIKRYIDYLSIYKMNRFHWHLTEDQGWRIEIKRYPKLTEVGAWRNGSMVGPYSLQQFDSVRYGGYYTQDQIREVVAYAARRHITIVPEIEMPGHSTAALAAYPWLSCTGSLFEVGKAWGVYDDVYCTKDSTFEFLENVLSEVVSLFPGKYVHIGGDECPKVRWKECPQCQALIKREGLKDEHELQSYFIGRIEKFLNSKGKQIIGWDEILEGGLAPNAAVMSWRGAEGGIAAAKEKHRVVMSPYSHCYFDFYQGTPAYEPLAIGGYTPIETVYSYEPTPDTLNVDERQYILGAQGNVWTEYMTTTEKVEYMAIPRMAALAEVVWSPKELRDYADFRRRLLRHFRLLDNLGVNYSRAIYQVRVTAMPGKGGSGIAVGLSSTFDSTGLRYTLNGTDPMAASDSYTKPIRIKESCELRVGYFEKGKPVGRIISQMFEVSKSTGKSITLATPPDPRYPGSGAFTLVDGIRGDTTRFGQNWIAWAGPDMEATIDLGMSEEISMVRLNIINAEASWIYPPREVVVMVSQDGKDFRKVAGIDADEVLRRGQSLKIGFEKQRVRFAKVIARNFGIIPDGNPGAGSSAWVFVDEISID